MKTFILTALVFIVSIILTSTDITGSGSSANPAQSPALRTADTLGRRVAVYAVQVGAFSLQENADKLVSRLKSKGIDAVIYDNLIDGKRLLYLVWVGRFDSAEDAIREIRRIEDLTGIRGVLREQMVWRRK